MANHKGTRVTITEKIFNDVHVLLGKKVHGTVIARIMGLGSTTVTRIKHARTYQEYRGVQARSHDGKQEQQHAPRQPANIYSQNILKLDKTAGELLEAANALLNRVSTNEQHLLGIMSLLHKLGASLTALSQQIDKLRAQQGAG